jgi:hypothetical protein
VQAEPVGIRGAPWRLVVELMSPWRCALGQVWSEVVRLLRLRQRVDMQRTDRANFLNLAIEN